jgi:hypothetical protein
VPLFTYILEYMCYRTKIFKAYFLQRMDNARIQVSSVSKVRKVWSKVSKDLENVFKEMCLPHHTYFNIKKVFHHFSII